MKRHKEGERIARIHARAGGFLLFCSREAIKHIFYETLISLICDRNVPFYIKLKAQQTTE
jgi:hypothetical protein